MPVDRQVMIIYFLSQILSRVNKPLKKLTGLHPSIYVPLFFFITAFSIRWGVGEGERDGPLSLSFLGELCGLNPIKKPLLGGAGEMDL